MNPSSDVLPRTPINRQGASFFRPDASPDCEGESLTFCQCSLSGSDTQEVDEEEEGQTPKLKSGPHGAKDLVLFAALLQECASDIRIITLLAVQHSFFQICEFQLTFSCKVRERCWLRRAPTFPQTAK